MAPAVAAAFLTACSTTTWTPRPGELPAPVIAQLRSAGLPAEAFGAVVLRASDGAVILSHQAEVAMQPASTLKLLTTIVGLEQLGPAYRTRTELRTSANVNNGVLEGDLILRGLADPDLDWMSFRTMLQSVRNKGIRQIRGDLIVDRNYFNPARTDVGLPPFDETPEFRYNVIPDALLLNTNLLQFALSSSDAGVSVSTIPALDGVTVVSHLTLGGRACADWEDGWKTPEVTHGADGKIQIHLIGEFPRNCVATTEINVLDRAEYADLLFRTLWRELGGEWLGHARESESKSSGTTVPAEKLLAQHRSRTLAEVTREINKRSDNPMARLLFLTLGATTPAPTVVDDAPTKMKSDRAVREWLSRQHISDNNLVLENGSGLSRKERIQPRQLAGVLQAAYHSNWAPEFQASLPIIAVDGAMEKRLRDSPAAKRGRIKTGSLRNVSSIAGYVPDLSGDMYVIVAIVNFDREAGSVSAIAKPVLDSLIDWLAHSGTPPR